MSTAVAMIELNSMLRHVKAIPVGLMDTTFKLICLYVDNPDIIVIAYTRRHDD